MGPCLGLSRVSKEFRVEVLRALKAHPGVGVRELARLLDRPTMTVSLELRQLASEGAVLVRRRGAAKAHYLPGHEEPEPVPAQLVAVLDFVRRHGPVAQRDVKAAFATVPRSTVAHRLERLVAA